MSWSVEYTDEFGEWWNELSENEQEDFTSIVELLTEYGPRLSFPYSSGIKGSRYAHRRELRVQSGGKCLIPLQLIRADPAAGAMVLDRFFGLGRKLTVMSDRCNRPFGAL